MGVLEREFIDFMETAVDQKMDILQVLENPASTAKKLNMTLSKRSINDLHRLAPSQVEKVEDPVAREVTKFFHAVAKDGRFLSTWTIRPYSVSAELKVRLSEPAIDRILSYGAFIKPGGTFRHVTAIVAGIGIVAGVVIVIVAAKAEPSQGQIIDASGVSKF